MPITIHLRIRGTMFEYDLNDLMFLSYYKNILNYALNLCYGTTRYISYGYSVVSVDEAPMEEI